MKSFFRVILFLSFFCFVSSGCSSNEPSNVSVSKDKEFVSVLSLSTGSSVNMEMGNPSKATTSTANSNNYLQDETYFTLSYNCQKGEPNWVGWRDTVSDFGSAPRYSFYSDTFLPSTFKLVTTSDYTGSGFDRGHMCDHADRAANDTSSKATFTMANIIPQAPILNQQTWVQLEDYCRTLVNQGNTLYIYSGPYGSGGDGSSGSATVIGSSHKVTVPSKCWKVIMVIPGSGSATDYTKVSSSTRLIAVIMPNSQSVSTGTWKTYRVSVNAVESLTGYTFFDKVSSSIITPLKAKVDNL